MLFLLIFAILLTYLPILNSYFQQDEWFDFGFEQIRWLSESGFLATLKKALFSLSPIIQTYNLLNYKLFGIQNTVPAITVLLLILVNSFLWYKIVLKISRSNLVASISMLFGYLSFLANQSVTWVMPAVAIQFSFLFLNLSVLSYIEYELKKNKRSLLLLFFFVILAVFSKLNSFFLIFFFPVIYIVRNYRLSDFSQNIKKIFLPALTFSLLFYVFFLEKLSIFSFGMGRFVQGKTQILINLIFLPLKSISQAIFSNPTIIYNLGDQLVTKYYRQVPSDFLKYVFFAEFLSIMFSILFIVIFLFATHSFLKKNKDPIQFFLLLFVFSFIPYSMDLFSTGTGFLESRYYNIAVFSVGAFVGLFFVSMKQKIGQIKSDKVKNFLFGLSFVLLATYFSTNIVLIQNSLFHSNYVTKKREAILKTSSDDIGKKLSNRFIIYIRDENYLGTIDQNITGRNFQAGFLYPFLVYNFQHGKIPSEVFSDNYFWDMNFQGVKKTDKYEIGLFYELSRLKEYVVENNFPLNYVYSIKFDYSSANKQNAFSNYKDIVYANYFDISDEVRSDFQNKNEK